MSPVLRTFVLATIAVPIVMYGVMPQLHKARARWATGTQMRAETRRRHTAQP
jgi:AmiR/NasT family two-component response regulator